MIPSKHNIAKGVPNNKNGKHDDPYKYLPVSVLPSFKKIPEKLIANRLFAFLRNDILYEINLDLHLAEIQLMPFYHLLTT